MAEIDRVKFGMVCDEIASMVVAKVREIAGDDQDLITTYLLGVINQSFHYAQSGEDRNMTVGSLKKTVFGMASIMVNAIQAGTMSMRMQKKECVCVDCVEQSMQPLFKMIDEHIRQKIPEMHQRWCDQYLVQDDSGEVDICGDKYRIWIDAHH